MHNTIIYILERDEFGQQISLIKSEFTDSAMSEVFSDDERMRLDAGLKVCRVHSFGHLEIVSATALALRLLEC